MLDPGRQCWLGAGLRPGLFKRAPRAVAGPVPAGDTASGRAEGEVRAAVSAQWGSFSAAEIHRPARLGVDPSSFHTTTERNDELPRVWPALCKHLCISRATPALWW